MLPATPLRLNNPESHFQRVSLLLKKAREAAEQNATLKTQEIFKEALEEAKKLPSNLPGMLLRTICHLQSWRYLDYSQKQFSETFNTTNSEVKKLDKQLSHQRDSHPFLSLLGSFYLCLYTHTKHIHYIQCARDILVRVAQNKARQPQFRDESPQARAQFNTYLQAGLACLLWFRQHLDYSEEVPDLVAVQQAVEDWLERAFATHQKSESLNYLLGLSNALLDQLALIEPPQHPQPPLRRAIEVLHEKEDEKKPLPLSHLYLLGMCQYRAAFDNNPSGSDTLIQGIQAYDTFFRAFKGASTDKTFTGDGRALIFVADSARLLYWMTRVDFYRERATFFIQLLKKLPSPHPFLSQFVIKIYEIQICLIDKTPDKLSGVIDQLRELIRNVNMEEDPPISGTLIINLQETIKFTTMNYQKLKKVHEAEYDLWATRIGNKINDLEIYSLSNNALYNELNKLNLVPDLDESLIVENAAKEGPQEVS